MLLSESAFNEIRSLPDYTTYLCKYASEISTKASGSCFDKHTSYLEAIYFHLQKQLQFIKSLEEVSTYIKEITGVEIFEGWMSPVFIEQFNYYCQEDKDE